MVGRLGAPPGRNSSFQMTDCWPLANCPQHALLVGSLTQCCSKIGILPAESWHRLRAGGPCACSQVADRPSSLPPSICPTPLISGPLPSFLIWHCVQPKAFLLPRSGMMKCLEHAPISEAGIADSYACTSGARPHSPYRLPCLPSRLGLSPMNDWVRLRNTSATGSGCRHSEEGGVPTLSCTACVSSHRIISNPLHHVRFPRPSA